MFWIIYNNTIEQDFESLSMHYLSDPFLSIIFECYDLTLRSTHNYHPAVIKDQELCQDKLLEYSQDLARRRRKREVATNWVIYLGTSLLTGSPYNSKVSWKALRMNWLKSLLGGEQEDSTSQTITLNLKSRAGSSFGRRGGFFRKKKKAFMKH